MKFFVAFVLTILIAEAADSRQYASADVARRFVISLERKGQQAVAARDPTVPNTFVAALYVGSDLLVVRARHPSAEKISAQIQGGQYVQVFSALRATPNQTGKLFIVDAAADGILSSTPGAERVDLVREEDGLAIRFDGVIAGQGLTATEYDRRLAAADAEYARILTLLTAAAR